MFDEQTNFNTCIFQFLATNKPEQCSYFSRTLVIPFFRHSEKWNILVRNWKARELQQKRWWCSRLVFTNTGTKTLWLIPTKTQFDECIDQQHWCGSWWLLWSEQIKLKTNGKEVYCLLNFKFVVLKLKTALHQTGDGLFLSVSNKKDVAVSFLSVLEKCLTVQTSPYIRINISS